MTTKKAFGNRKFYSLPDNPNRISKNRFSGTSKKREDIIKLVKYIDENVIGKNSTFSGPYGRRKVFYCDYTASGRSLQFIEDYILKEVLPCYGNTHSTTGITSLQSTLFRHEARDIFRNCVHASDQDAIIFAGHGCTGAVHKLIHALDLKEPPVVFVGPCEHHSNLLPWREMGAKIVRISETKEGFLDLDDLETQLLAHQNCGAQLIGCFSAASNITGILADDVATTLLLHQHGALAFWDYATAAPYVPLDMNPVLPGVGESAVHKDAMFFSVHKFIGGVQTPGVLIAKKSLFKNSVPNGCGGGSVFFVTKENHRYMQDTESREEGGTTAVVEVVRAGLVMQLKEAVGSPAIMAREEKITRTVLSHFRNIPELILLGNSSHCLKRLPIFSFIIRHPRGSFLHHNFVCSVLNDVFGIQARGGCACAGPYAQDLMGIDVKLAEKYQKILLDDSHLEKISSGRIEESSYYEMLRPGFSRISLPFCISDADLAFVLEALKMVATEAWKLLPQYVVNPETGEWRHHSNSVFRDRKWLSSIRYIDGRMVIHERKVSTQGTCPIDYAECLHIARSIFNKARKMAQRYPLSDQTVIFDEKTEPLRWFMLPSEAQDLLLGNSQNVKHTVPFDPVEYAGSKGDPLVVNIANMFTNDPKSPKNGKSSPTVQETKSVAANVYSDASHISNSNMNDVNLSNSLNQIFNPGSNTSHNNLVPSIPNHLLPKRQNSFSSEISNSEYLSDVSNFCQPSYTNNTLSYAGTCQSPFVNTLDNYCLSPQPAMSSPLLGQVDCNSHIQYQQQNYVPMQQTGYVNPPAANVIMNDNVLTRHFSFPYIDNSSGIRTSHANYSSQDCSNNNNNGNVRTDQPHPVNKVHFSLGSHDSLTRQRCNSVGSSLILGPKNRSNLGINYSKSLTDGEGSLNLSECSLSSNEDIHAYVTEVTKELATEIKSEIREVISKVEDVLSESTDVEHPLMEHRNSRSEVRPSNEEKLERTNSMSSASANDIAQYLMGVSREMAKEMKCEIRELMSSVVSPDSSPMPDKKSKKVTIDSGEKSDGAGAKDIKLRKNGITRFGNENISQSRDSGINLSYSDNISEGKAKEKDVTDEKSENSEKSNSSDTSKRERSESLDSFQENGRAIRGRSESLDSLQGNEDSDATAKNQLPKRKISRASKKMEKCIAKNQLSEESSNDEGVAMDGALKPKWHCPSKAVWKPTVEAIHEFEMIKDGDRILVCLSGGKDSLTLLHTLHQYQFYALARKIRFELGAVTVDPKSTAYNPKPLVPYLESLGVPYVHEEQCILEQTNQAEINSVCSFCSRMKRGRLYATARKEKYNVLAFGQHLDDLAESFLTSAFHNGRLRSMKAHYYVTDRDRDRDKDIRVIRPFVYVREKALRQFAESRKLPVIPENCPACFAAPKERHRSKQLLAQQEVLFPRLFSSLKAALHPLISYRYTSEEGRVYKYTTDSDEASLP